MDQDNDEIVELSSTFLISCQNLAPPVFERIEKDSISDDELGVGILYIKDTMNHKDTMKHLKEVHFFSVLLLSKLFTTQLYDKYTSNDIKRIEKEHNLAEYIYPGTKFIKSNMFLQKLLLFPLHFRDHYSLIVFVRPDLYHKHNDQSCLLWLDSCGSYHKNKITENMLNNLKRYVYAFIYLYRNYTNKLFPRYIVDDSQRKNDKCKVKKNKIQNIPLNLDQLNFVNIDQKVCYLLSIF
jgi:hypothetical protein